MNKDNTMMLRLYAFPVFFVLIAFVVMYVLHTFIPNSFTGNFSTFAEKSKSIAPLIGACLMGIGLILGAINSYKLWQWTKGNYPDCCHVCGGMTNYHANGRYGAYFKCMACGKNRSDKT